MNLAQWIALLLSDQNPLLPTAGVMQWYLRLGWIAPVMVFALWLMRLFFARLGSGPSGNLRGSVHAALCVGVVLLVALPGSASLTYWLGLAFNAPALLSVMLSVSVWRQSMWSPESSSAQSQRWALMYAGLGVLLGYVLLLDVLALLPLQLYAFGFSPLALVLVLLVSLIPCSVLNPVQRGNGWTLLMPVALLVFVATRLPTGNVWDVVMDPLLWVVLQVRLVMTVRANSKSSLR